MTGPSRGLLDTSVFIAAENGRSLREEWLPADIQLIPVDADAAVMWARMQVRLAETGHRVGVNDLWVAASAAAHDLPVVTQDKDFGVLEGVGGLAIVRV